MPSIIVTLYFGEVSFIPVKPFLVKSGECVISVAYISWLFSLLEAILVDVSVAGVCMTSCSLLTKNSRWKSFLLCRKPTRLVHLTQISRNRGITLNS